MKFFKRSERGFTLVELLVAIPIIGLLGLAMGAVLVQLLHSDRISQRMVAVRQVQAAGDRVSVDGWQAQFVSGVGTDMSSDNWALIMDWSGGWLEGDGFHSRRVHVKYQLEESTNGLHSLRRNQWSTKDETSPPESSIIVGQYLDVDQMYCQWDDSDRTFSFKVVSVVGTKTEERTYNIRPRALV